MVEKPVRVTQQSSATASDGSKAGSSSLVISERCVVFLDSSRKLKLTVGNHPLYELYSFVV
jgi:hypothetical protein